MICSVVIWMIVLMCFVYYGCESSKLYVVWINDVDCLNFGFVCVVGIELIGECLDEFLFEDFNGMFWYEVGLFGLDICDIKMDSVSIFKGVNGYMIMFEIVDYYKCVFVEWIWF